MYLLIYFLHFFVFYCHLAANSVGHLVLPLYLICFTHIYSVQLFFKLPSYFDWLLTMKIKLQVICYFSVEKSEIYFAASSRPREQGGQFQTEWH